MHHGPLRRIAAVALVAAAVGAPEAGAQGFDVDVVTGSADVLDPALAGGDSLYLAGRRPSTAIATDAAVLVRRDGRWTPAAAPATPRRPAEQVAVAARGPRAWRFDAGLGLASSTAFEDDGAREAAHQPLAQAATSAAACNSGGASRVGLATDDAGLVASVTTLPRAGDATFARALAIGTTRDGTTTWRCSASPVPGAGEPATDGRGRFGVPVVRIARGLSRLFLVTGDASDPADRPLVEEELGPVAGTTLACDAADANPGAAAWGGDGGRYAAAVGQDGTSVRLWRDADRVDLPLGAPIAALHLVRDPAGGVLLAAVTTGPGCASRDVRVLRVGPDDAGDPVVTSDETAATGLAPGCSGRIGLAAAEGGQAQVAVQVGTGGDCSASVASGRHVVVLTERAAPTARGSRRAPAAAAAGRSRAAARAHRAR